ncbi:MAG: capsid cement protein [Terriglobales bacterium]
MAGEIKGPVTTVTHRRSYLAEGGALTRGFGVVAGTNDNQVKTPAGAAARCVGVMAETTAQDKVGPVVVFGECIAKAGGIITRGARVKAETEGDFIAGDAADVETVGFAISAAAADGDEFVLFVQPIHKRS